MSLLLSDNELAARQSRPPMEKWSIESLLEMRQRINDLLPATALKDLDLEKELVLQFLTLKNLQAKVLEDEHVPANQRAQVANSVGTTLQNLAKMQVDHYSSERFKKIEMMLINLLNTFPTELTESFFAQYERLDI